MPVARCFVAHLHWKLIEILHILCSNYPTPHLRHAKGGDTLWYGSAVAASEDSDSAAKDVEITWSIACRSRVRERQQVFLTEIFILPGFYGFFTL